MGVKETMLREYRSQGALKRKRARELFRIDVNKTGKVYDYFVSAGWVCPNGSVPVEVEEKVEVKAAS